MDRATVTGKTKRGNFEIIRISMMVLNLGPPGRIVNKSGRKSTQKTRPNPVPERPGPGASAPAGGDKSAKRE
jgi:hypothetical protein